MSFRFKSVIKILSVNLKHHFIPHFFTALMIAFLTRLLFGISSLNAREAAQPLERLLSLTGPILLIPVFLPEQDENIRDLIRSKSTDYLVVCMVRLFYSIFFLAVIFGIFTGIMNCLESEVTIRHFIGGLSSGLFLGSLGFLCTGISQNSILGYMVSMIYFIANFFLKEELGMLYLFSMSSGSFTEKYWLLGSSATLLTITFVWLKSYH